MNIKIKNQILAGEFQEAYNGMNNLKRREMLEFLMDLARDSESITIYSFICYLISINESAHLHYSAALILSNSLCILEGAYPTALYHNKKALDLDQSNITYLQYLLLFHAIPEKLIKKQEAVDIARRVLEKDPTSELAQEVLREYDINLD